MMIQLALLHTLLSPAAHAFVRPTRHGPIKEPVWQCPGGTEPVLSVGVSIGRGMTDKGCVELRRNMVLVAGDDWLDISEKERALVDACPWQVCAEVVRPDGPYDFPWQRSLICAGPDGEWTPPAADPPASAEPGSPPPSSTD